MSRDNILWTAHARQKMKFYGLSEQRLRRVLKNPQRIEEGIAPETTAVMSPARFFKKRNGFSQHRVGSYFPRKSGEIWLMYQKIQQKKKDKIKIISAWRYPGTSPKGKEIPIPADIRKELRKL